MPRSAALTGPHSVSKKMSDGPQVALHGQVFTKPHVVSLILDLVGYTSSAPLEARRLLDPGCGDGAFIVEAARRLLERVEASAIDRIAESLLGVEKDEIPAKRCI